MLNFMKRFLSYIKLFFINSILFLSSGFIRFGNELSNVVIDHSSEINLRHINGFFVHTKSPKDDNTPRDSHGIYYSIQLRKIYISDTPEGKILRFVLNNLVENVIDEVVSLTSSNMRKIALITKSTELRWLMVNKRLEIKCPSCGNDIRSSCARYKCFQCDQISMVSSPQLMTICDSCVSYKKSCVGPGDNLMDPIISLSR